MDTLSSSGPVNRLWRCRICFHFNFSTFFLFGFGDVLLWKWSEWALHIYRPTEGTVRKEVLSSRNRAW